MPLVTFIPVDKHIEVETGTTILETANKLSLTIPASCGGKGLCGKCRIQIKDCLTPATPSDKKIFSPTEITDGWRLACLTKVTTDITVILPPIPNKTITLIDFGAVDVIVKSEIETIQASLSKPSLDNQDADMERLEKIIGREISSRSSLKVIQNLSRELRKNDFKITAIMSENELLGIAPYLKEVPVLGLAVDVGTTTVAGVLCDLKTGKSLATASTTNPQAIRGDDVISRIEYAGRGNKELQELQSLIIKAINQIVKETIFASQMKRENIYKIVLAGNTTMHHLLLGFSPMNIGVSPFIAVRLKGFEIEADKLGFKIATGGKAYAMPNISGYVGGDIVAGINAYKINKSTKNILFIDIGTNGEMALRNGNKTYACSTAAGPAFEGARISCGMRASTGAISKVGFNGKTLDIETIDNAPAKGLCGTGLLDCVAALLDCGIITETGNFAEGSELDSIPNAIKKNLTKKEYIIVEAQNNNGNKVSLTDKDIRELQLAKGSIAAGYKSMLSMAGITEDNLDKIILAGAFGNFMRPKSAIRIGLLPENFDLTKVEFVGNAALAGAQQALLNLDERKNAEELVKEIEYIELSGRADFQTFFMETMMFPNNKLNV